MKEKGKIVALLAVAAMAVAGCGGDDETTTSSTTSTTTAGATGATGASGEAGAGTITFEDAERAFQDEGIDTNEVEPSATLITPPPESAFSLITNDTGTVAHGGVYVYESSEDAEKALENAEKGSDLEYRVVGNVLISQDADPYHGVPTSDQMAEIVSGE